MGLVFFDKSDAQSLAESVREEGSSAARHSPTVCTVIALTSSSFPAFLQMKHSGSKVAKRVRVIPTSLSSVYNMAVAPAEAPGQPVFRFVPQPEQVEAALKLYQHAGVNAAGFMGVPLFQAEGLTVISEGKRKTPLFFRWGVGEGASATGLAWPVCDSVSLLLSSSSSPCRAFSQQAGFGRGAWRRGFRSAG